MPQDFVEHGSVGIHLVASDGTIAWANKADMAICGYGPDTYIGMLLWCGSLC